MLINVEAFNKECCVPKAFCRSDLTHASLTRSHVLKHSAGASVAAAAESGSDGACSGQALALQRLQRPGPCPSAHAAARPLPRRRLQRPGPCPGGACSGQALLRLSGSGGACSGQALALQRFRVSLLLPADAGKARIATRDAAHRAAPAAAAAQQQLL